MVGQILSSLPGILKYICLDFSLTRKKSIFPSFGSCGPYLYHSALQCNVQEDEGATATAQPGQCQHRHVRGWRGSADSDREVQRQGSLLSRPPPQQGGCLGQETLQLRPQLQRKGQSGDTAGRVIYYCCKTKQKIYLS